MPFPLGLRIIQHKPNKLVEAKIISNFHNEYKEIKIKNHTKKNKSKKIKHTKKNKN
jgi:hypothetical protein